MKLLEPQCTSLEDKSVNVKLFSFLTCADVHDTVERVSPLNNVHSQSGETDVVLHDQRIRGDGLNHVAHEEEPLGVLKTAFC